MTVWTTSAIMVKAGIHHYPHLSIPIYLATLMSSRQKSCDTGLKLFVRQTLSTKCFLIIWLPSPIV